MAAIRDLINNRTIHYVQPNQTVFEAANYMVDCNVGAVPVLEDTKLVGIFSERDIMRRVVTEGRNPLTVLARSMPFISGMAKSATIKLIAGLPASCRSASLPLSAPSTLKPSACR